MNQKGKYFRILINHFHNTVLINQNSKLKMVFLLSEAEIVNLMPIAGCPAFMIAFLSACFCLQVAPDSDLWLEVPACDGCVCVDGSTVDAVDVCCLPNDPFEFSPFKTAGDAEGCNDFQQKKTKLIRNLKRRRRRKN